MLISFIFLFSEPAESVNGEKQLLILLHKPRRGEGERGERGRQGAAERSARVCLFVCATREVVAEGILALKWLNMPRPQNPSNLTNSPPTRKQLAPLFEQAGVEMATKWVEWRGLAVNSVKSVCLLTAEANTRLQEGELKSLHTGWNFLSQQFVWF